jgi:hypothetical protein
MEGEVTYTKNMLKKLLLLSLALCTTSAALADDLLGHVGDSVQVWRHTFGSDLRYGRDAILRDMVPLLSRDRLTRTTVIAENAKTGEVVVLHFSDAFNVATKENMPWKNFEVAMKSVHGLGKKAVSFSNYQIYGVHDEGIAAKPGALLMMWSRKLKPGRQALVRQHLISRLMPRLGKDDLRRTLYLTEGLEENELVNIAVSDPATPGMRHRQISDEVKQHYREPLKVEIFRIFSVTRETRK